MKSVLFALLLLLAANAFGQERNLTIPPPLNDTVINASLSIRGGGGLSPIVKLRETSSYLLVINNRQFAYSSLQFLTKEDEKYVKQMDLLKDASSIAQYTADTNIQAVLKLTVAKKLYKRIKKQEKKAARK